MLKVSNLRHSFGSSPILTDISLSVGKGEIVALLGPSGCGKSTLLKLIAGLLQIQEGVCDHSTSTKPSFVFQEPSLMPWATVFENVSLPLKLSHQVATDRVNQVLEYVHMEKYADRYPNQLSGGQKMRVSIARALASSPELLLLDEPFGALDEQLRFKMNELILKLRDDLSIGTLFVTHSVYEAAYLADRVLVIKDGRIAGSVQPSLDRSQTANDQRASINFLNATKRISSILAGENS